MRPLCIKGLNCVCIYKIPLYITMFSRKRKESYWRHKLTQICLVDSSILINWMSPFPILVVSGVFFNFYYFSTRNSCKQTVKTLIRRLILQHLTWDYTVCQCPLWDVRHMPVQWVYRLVSMTDIQEGETIATMMPVLGWKWFKNYIIRIFFKRKLMKVIPNLSITQY